MNENLTIPLEFSEKTFKEIEKVFINIAKDSYEKVKEDEKQKAYFNKTEACEYLNVSYHTLNKMIDDGLPVISKYGVHLVRKKDIDEFMELNKK